MSKAMNSKPFALLVDNLSVHKTLYIRGVYASLKITPIFKVPYSPEFNGIEHYWAALKKIYKAMMLEKVLKDEGIDIKEVIETAIKQVPKQTAINCAKKGMDRILEIKTD